MVGCKKVAGIMVGILVSVVACVYISTPLLCSLLGLVYMVLSSTLISTVIAIETYSSGLVGSSYIRGSTPSIKFLAVNGISGLFIIVGLIDPSYILSIGLAIKICAGVLGLWLLPISTLIPVSILILLMTVSKVGLSSILYDDGIISVVSVGSIVLVSVLALQYKHWLPILVLSSLWNVSFALSTISSYSILFISVYSVVAMGYLWVMFNGASIWGWLSVLSMPPVITFIPKWLIIYHTVDVSPYVLNTMLLSNFIIMAAYIIYISNSYWTNHHARLHIHSHWAYPRLIYTTIGFILILLL